MQPSSASSTSQILRELAAGEVDPSLDAILAAFGRRAFGAALLLAIMPAFLPLPFGVGAISGPLVSVLGLQMLFARRQPWLPKRWREKTVPRARLDGFNAKMGGVLRRIERLCKPRLNGLATQPWATVFTGAQLILLGILLSLPIPLTNYPFGLLLVLYALALIERDGVLQLVAWVLGLSTITASVLLSSEVVGLLTRLWT
ncbi:MAG: exopolysaccharide biosynthesis protein [Xanthomonadales bacterium]|jgi:hypothetical protein|nr:exopolysaccharide biosynthesis protein [Xanthomonadales bacterium]